MQYWNHVGVGMYNLFVKGSTHDDFMHSPPPEFRFKPAGGHLQPPDMVLVSGMNFKQAEIDRAGRTYKNLTDVLLEIENEYPPQLST